MYCFTVKELHMTESPIYTTAVYFINKVIVALSLVRCTRSAGMTNTEADAGLLFISDPNGIDLH